MNKMPAGLLSYAYELAQQRVAANSRYKGTNKERPGRKRSALYGAVDRDVWTEAIGILGEMIARHEIDTCGRYDAYTAGTFLSPTPNDGADIIIDGVRIAVKATEGEYARVNQQAYERGDVDYYYFYQVASDSYQRTAFGASDIAGWEIKTKHTPYFERKL